MLGRIVAYLIFAVVEGLIILAAIPTVLFLYLPYVAIKGIVMTITGRARPRPDARAGGPQANTQVNT